MEREEHGKPTDAGRRRFLRRMLVGAAAVVAAGGAGSGFGIAEAHTFERIVERHVLAGLRRPLRLAFLTDLHLGPYIGAPLLDAWVRAANESRPDAILIGGDVVDHWYRGDLSEVVAALSRLHAPLGAWAVPGNHDYMVYPDLVALRRALRRAGVALLVNRGVRLRDDVWLAGVDDFREGVPELERALQGRPRDDVGTIALTHNPDAFPAFGAAPGLALAGHTHGGQICVPGYGPVVTSSIYGRRFAAGWVRAPAPAFVSRGLGVTVLPMRIACPAELVVLDLVPS